MEGQWEGQQLSMDLVPALSAESLLQRWSQPQVGRGQIPWRGRQGSGAHGEAEALGQATSRQGLQPT